MSDNTSDSLGRRQGRLVAFRYRHVHTINRQRLGLAIALLILVPVAAELTSLVAVAIPAVLLWAMIAYETRLYGESRSTVRHDFAVGGPGVEYEEPIGSDRSTGTN